MYLSVAGFVRRLVEPAVAYLMNKRSKNIEFQLQMNALSTTARFIEQEMPGVRTFENRLSLLDCAVEAAARSGLFLEFGVHTGKSINYIAERTAQTVHGFDSFDGLPEFWRDGYPQGKFALAPKSEDSTRNLPKVRSNVELHVGWFKDTLQPFVAKHPGKVSFIHVDCDLYSSAQTIFRELGEQIGSGTVLVFDEYFNFPFWQEYEHKAFREFLQERSLSYEPLGYARYAEQFALRIR
jgi:hypothetical protein